MPNTLILQELKRLILIKAGIRVISPSDCLIISLSIQKELKKNISETTIKRLFGFAVIKHEFSKFTINTLMEYVGLVDEKGLINNNLASGHEKSNEIEQVRLKAERITHYTLLNIRNRCSVPYKMTIARAYANEDLIFFRTSKYKFSALISQPGYGKSILLSHAVQEMFIDENAPYQKDIVVFLNASDILNKEYDELRFEDRIKSILGLHNDINLLDYFDEQWKTHEIKLFIIIDAFSELILTKNSKLKIIETILNFISSIETDSIKLLLSMRSTTWSRFYEKIRHSYVLKNNWYLGSFFSLSGSSNVPELSDVEVKQIFEKMSNIDYTKISDNLKAQLKFPFHIQWYYQLKDEYPAFESYTNIIYYEIISRFIEEKIYNSTYATEKVLFCKKIIQLTNYGRRGSTVLKTDLIKEMPMFSNAYEELLSNGIIMEEKQLKSGFPSEYVRFIQPHIFEYFLFIELYGLFSHKMDDKYFELINNEYTGNQVRFQLLQWSVRLMIRLHNFKDLDSVLSLKLNHYEKNYLVYFIAENVNYLSKQDPGLLSELKTQHLHQILIKQLVHFDFVDSCYKDALTSLIQIADSPNDKLFYNVILGTFDCLALDTEKLREKMTFLQPLANERSKWEVDPYEVFHLVNLKINGERIKNHDILTRLETLKSSKSAPPVYDSLPNIQQNFSYILLLMINHFYGSQEQVPKIIEGITREYPKLKKTKQFFSIFLLTILTQANTRVNPGAKTNQMEKILSKAFDEASKTSVPTYAQCLWLSVMAEQDYNRKDYSASLKHAKECLVTFTRNNLVVNVIYTYDLIIKIYKALNNKENVIKYQEEKISILAERGADLHLFEN